MVNQFRCWGRQITALFQSQSKVKCRNLSGQLSESGSGTHPQAKKNAWNFYAKNLVCHTLPQTISVTNYFTGRCRLLLRLAVWGRTKRLWSFTLSAPAMNGLRITRLLLRNEHEMRCLIRIQHVVPGLTWESLCIDTISQQSVFYSKILNRNLCESSRIVVKILILLFYKIITNWILLLFECYPVW